jgi:hypothetical protein
MSGTARKDLEALAVCEAQMRCIISARISGRREKHTRRDAKSVD